MLFLQWPYIKVYNKDNRLLELLGMCLTALGFYVLSHFVAIIMHFIFGFDVSFVAMIISFILVLNTASFLFRLKSITYRVIREFKILSYRVEIKLLCRR